MANFCSNDANTILQLRTFTTDAFTRKDPIETTKDFDNDVGGQVLQK
jgi:hypothetical protein